MQSVSDGGSERGLADELQEIHGDGRRNDDRCEHPDDGISRQRRERHGQRDRQEGQAGKDVHEAAFHRDGGFVIRIGDAEQQQARSRRARGVTEHDQAALEAVLGGAAAEPTRK